MPTSRHTKIVATLGPASADASTVDALVAAGLNVARLNASHGDRVFFERCIERVRASAAAANRHVAILLDLRGPKIRVGRLRDAQPLMLVAGEDLEITTEDVEGTVDRIPCTYAGLPRDVEVGDTLLLDDGLLELRVRELLGERAVRCEIVIGGLLKPNKGINVPGRALSTPAFEAKDLDDLQTGIELGVDAIALSFVRRGEDVRLLRREIHLRGAQLPIISKIEKPQALDALAEIFEESDGIMVARGDLGVEVAPERVPGIQKHLIREANRRGLPVITATQMLESMIENPRPTRAEASDVANAILDGTDAVMLSGETATGRYPVRALEMMDRIARETEHSRFYARLGQGQNWLANQDLSVRAMADSARRVAAETDAKAILVYTLSGNTARVMSKYKPGLPIVALCPDPSVCRRLQFYAGVVPVITELSPNTDAMLAEGDRRILAAGLVAVEDPVVVLGGTMQLPGATNMLQLRRVGKGAIEHGG